MWQRTNLVGCEFAKFSKYVSKKKASLKSLLGYKPQKFVKPFGKYEPRFPLAGCEVSWILDKSESSFRWLVINWQSS